MSTPNTRYGAEQIIRMLYKKRSIFFIGIGGVHMSALAHIAMDQGYIVGGSDRTETALTRSLSDSGIDVKYGHCEKNLDGYEVVVYTVAVPPDNPEYQRAQREGLPCISRADFLGYIMTRCKNRIGIAGMHGKSTCTSIVSQIFIDGETDPTILSGAELPALNASYRIGKDEFFIFEACEYMDSFLSFYPTIAVILNIEMDHVDYFKSMDQIYRSFVAFMNKTGEDGVCVVNADDPHVMKCAAEYGWDLITFGVHDSRSDFHAENIDFSRGRASFDIICKGNLLCRANLAVPGYHNIYNALAAAACAWLCGISGEMISAALGTFTGAKRRMEHKGQLNGADLYEDYAHHPTEIAATIDSARRMGYNRVLCVFQPHTYSRTAELFDSFASALRTADEVVLTDIYSARETDTFGISSGKLADAVGGALYFSDFSDAADYFASKLMPGDVLLIMGAGDIYKLSDLLSNMGKA
ncbi:MAG: UDP-N-acetylmuramate--L-alanine ligase [Clostridiales bacterium]|nr:UDP-N-acetylmuramate--L-alanine ligase [Clostridiales bacterium]